MPLPRKLARICWNTAGWTRPSGDASAIEANTYAAERGFGHEEWLLRSEWLVDGWRYSFLEPVRKSRAKYVGECFDVSLFAIDEEHRRLMVARIHEVEVIGEVEALEATAEFQARDWLSTMVKEIQAVGGDPGDVSHHEPTLLFNIRFLTANVELFDPLQEIAGEGILRRNRYQLYDLWDVIGTKGRGPFSGTRDLRPEAETDRRAIDVARIDPFHNKIQNRLFCLLSERYGDEAVHMEVGGVDIRIHSHQQLTLIEVKSNRSPRLAIREALGQLLEYALYPPQSWERLPRLVIAAPGELDVDGERYLEELARLGLHLVYVQATPQLQELPLALAGDAHE